MTMVGETLFVDTNVFLSATDRSRSNHDHARDLLRGGIDGGYHLALSGQVIREYLVVATRPVDVNGLGLSTGLALQNIDVFARPPFVFCDETEAVSQRLRELVQANELVGKRIHDANIVATMIEEGIRRLITTNVADFSSFDAIEVVELGSEGDDSV